MAIKTSGALSLKDDIAGEFGDAADHKMSEFYRFGKHVPGENVPPAIDGAWSNAQYRFDGTTTAQYYVTKSWIGTLDTTLTPSVTSWVWDTPITIESNSTATTLQTSTHDYRIGTLQFSSPFGGDLVGVFQTYSIERRLSSSDSIVRSTLNLDVPTSGEISFSDLYAASDAVAVTSAISAFSTADFVGLSTNTAAPGAGLSSRTVLREIFTNPYGGASISIPEITVTIKGMYNAGSNGFLGFYGSAATSSTIANPHIKLITPDGSELYFGGVIASNATNEATNHVISASTINNQPAGDYTMAFEADCARSGDSQHSWATSAFTVTMSIS